MCRIAGFWDFNYQGQYDIQSTMVQMRDTLIHGGPDDAGYWKHEQQALAFGHRRLSILDLSPLGHQPWHFEHLSICYNGEVYNFKEVAEALQKVGYTFASNSDTEVIIKAWHYWGSECLHKFRGMWAFSLWDNHTRKLYLVRDRVGVKPLFWFFKNQVLLFASELKAFHKHPAFSKEINLDAIPQFMQYGYISEDECIFQDTAKLKPGHYLEIDQNQQIRIQAWWKIEDAVQSGILQKSDWEGRSDADVIHQLEGILKEAFALRMVADVPVGMFLSGGIDSSLVTALLQADANRPLKTFTIGFEEKAYNESQWAAKVAKHLGTDHTELICKPEDARDILPLLPHLYDEPFGDSSAIPTLLVSRLARQQVTVALSADGGDEAFFGYSHYARAIERHARFGSLHWQMAATAMKVVPPVLIQKLLQSQTRGYVSASDKFIKLRNLLSVREPLTFYDTMIKLVVQDELKDLLLHVPDGAGTRRPENLMQYMGKDFSFADAIMVADVHSYLPDDILVKVDRAAMSVALEGREPLLDHKILEFAAALPMKYKYREGKSKWILRQILYKHVPQEWIDRPKQGFAVPVNEWFRKELQEYYHTYLSTDRIKRDGIFNPVTVERMRNEYFKYKGMNAYKLWLLLMFNMWKDKYAA
jgi:asparagine synthase (glutamine-hydrolysing)